MKTKSYLILTLFFLHCSLAYGVIIYFQTIEWLVDSSKVVVLATGIRNGKLFLEKIGVIKNLKGLLDIKKVKRDSLIAFGYGYNEWSESDHYLLFFKQEKDGTLIFSEGYNLDKMNFPFHCLGNMDMEILHDKDKIYELVEKRAKTNPMEVPYSRTDKSKRNLGYLILPISGFKNARIYEAAQYFFVPADLKFKQKVLSEAMKIPISEFWIYQLVNFPDRDVKEFLFQCLNDKTPRYYFQGPNREKKVYFPVSQAAYSVLTRFGEQVEKPQLYDEKAEDMYPEFPDNYT